MAKDDPLDCRPASYQASATEGRFRELYWPVSPGIYRRHGEKLILTLWHSGELTCSIYEDYDDWDSQFDRSQ